MVEVIDLEMEEMEVTNSVAVVTNSVAVVTNSAAVTLKHEGKVIQEEQFSEAWIPSILNRAGTNSMIAVTLEVVVVEEAVEEAAAHSESAVLEEEPSVSAANLALVAIQDFSRRLSSRRLSPCLHR